jgi:hypothetical protein
VVTPWLFTGAAMLFLATIIVASWPQWWRNVIYERSPLTWFSSTQLVLCGFLSFTTFVLCSIAPLPEKKSRRTLLWLFLAAAFLFLACDEFFQIHERLREGVFKPHNIGVNLPCIGPGDFLLPLYMVAGIIVAWQLLPFLRLDRHAALLFSIAVVVAATAVIVDLSYTGPIDTMRFFVFQFIEELLETGAQTLMLISFAQLNWHLLELYSR